jgi:poly(A) polymerase
MRVIDARDGWRLSNEEAKAADAVSAAEALLREGRPNEAAYRYPLALQDAQALLPRPVVVPATVPAFPLTGRDLAQRGYAQGPALGRELQRLEQLWIDGGFVQSREALLAAIRPA